MAIILGVDVGYRNTKIYGANGTDIFSSTVEEGINEVNKKAIKVEFEENEYTIGQNNGSFSTDLNKIHDPIFRICLFAAIARQMEKTESIVSDVTLVTGLPAEYFKAQKEDLIKSLRRTTINIVLNNKPYRFTISNCIVFPQSAGLFLLNPENFKDQDNIIVDIGGLTIDISIFDKYTLVNTRTYELGMLKLYDKLVQAIKSEYSVSYDVLKAEDVIKKKTIIKDNKTIDVTVLVEKVLRKHTNEILMNVANGSKEYYTHKRNFIGGGVKYLKPYLPDALKNDDLYTNAKAFYKVGVAKFEKK